MTSVAYIVVLVFLNILSLWIISKQWEAFSITVASGAPPAKYVYEDMLTIEAQRQTTAIKYLAVDDQSYKVLALFNKAIGYTYPAYVEKFFKTININLDGKGVFYGYVAELQNVLKTFKDAKFVSYVAGNVANVVYALYPFAHIKVFSLQVLAPQVYVERDDYIKLITIPMAWVEGAKGQMKTIRSYIQEVQPFYAMFVPYKSTPQLTIEKFKETEPVLVHISESLESLKVIRMIRDVHTRISASAQEVSSYLDDLKLIEGDQLLLTNQKHRSIDGLYYVVARNQNVLVFESTKGKDWKPGDRVYDSKAQLAGVVQNNKSIMYVNDVALRARKETCISNPSLQTRTLCESPYDLFGKKKKASDVWDRPCEYDNDCPFFETKTFRGGCKQGVCELPLGAKQVGFRKYIVDNPALLNTWSLSAFRDVKEGFVNPSDVIYKPGERQYVYFPNQPNASMRDTDLLKYLKNVKGSPIGPDESPLDVLLKRSGLQEQNYFIPIHKKVSDQSWQLVLYKFETVEGHVINLKVENNKIVEVTVIGRIPEQLLHQTV